MDINPADLAHRDIYKLMIGAIVPRPIAWVSTLSADGVPNLAPFSFFNGVASNPPTVVFSVSYRESDHQPKDTLSNVRATGAFVVNFVSEPLAAAMNITAGEYAPEVDEFQRAGVTAATSLRVAPPRVAESLIHFECTLSQIVPIGSGPGSAHLVIGTVVHMHIDDRVYREGHKIDLKAYQPVGRLAGTSYARVNEVFDLQRPPSEIRPATQSAGRDTPAS